MNPHEELSQLSFDALAAAQPKLMQQQAVQQKRSKQTVAPMLRQYLEIKEQYPEHLLLFQVGDFYEVFFEDAKTVAAELEIRLTSRDKNSDDPTLMCGVPIHALESYLPKLLTKGYSCVVVSQVEESKKTNEAASPAAKKSSQKTMVRREITRIVTPGVRYEGDGIEEKRFNYLCAVLFGPRGHGTLAYSDVSTGVLRITEVESEEALLDALERIQPAEIILPTTIESRPVAGAELWLIQVRRFAREAGVHVVKRPFDALSAAQFKKRASSILKQAEVATEALEAVSPESVSSLGVLLDYVREVSFGHGVAISKFVVDQQTRTTLVDVATRRNLELFQTRIDGSRKNSLFNHIDKTKTAMGARLLSEWLSAPSADRQEIEDRHQAVAELTERSKELQLMRSVLGDVRDIERVVSRVTSRRAHPYDLRLLADSIAELPKLRALLSSASSALLTSVCNEFDTLEDIYQRLHDALAAEPPVKISDGGIFNPGYSETLDELRGKATQGRNWVVQLEAREREATGISGLKVKFNNVFGYFIEVTKTHAAKVPERYERKQTLVNAERYSTPELKELETSVLTARTKQLELEKSMFHELRDWVADAASRIQATARLLSLLDVISCFAHLAMEKNYSQPVMHDDARILIKAGRHPVVESVIGAHNFVPNDAMMNGEDRRFAVLTGPNMGGKSTYLRQIGVIQLLAQIGSFVPAKRAELGIVDRIFTRIGTADDITRGDSTFMVEMREASSIVRKATSRSLVLIDEIGRGTATTYGLAIAQAIAEWLHDHIACRTVFATHFHELTELAKTKLGAYSISVGVLERKNEIEFTHRIEERAADKSYGIEVARLAGLPEALLKRAEALLIEIDRGDKTVQTDLTLKTKNADSKRLAAHEEGPFIALLRQMADRIRNYSPDSMTPMEGLAELSKLHALLGAGSSAQAADAERAEEDSPSEG